MIWAKQRVAHTACMIYMKTIGALQFEHPSSVGELMMVGRDVDGRHQDVYISVPSRELLARFDGFEAVSETELPKEIDFIHVAEHTSGEFEKRFTLRDRRNRLRSCSRGEAISARQARYILGRGVSFHGRDAHRVTLSRPAPLRAQPCCGIEDGTW